MLCMPKVRAELRQGGGEGEGGGGVYVAELLYAARGTRGSELLYVGIVSICFHSHKRMYCRKQVEQFVIYGEEEYEDKNDVKNKKNLKEPSHERQRAGSSASWQKLKGTNSR